MEWWWWKMAMVMVMVCVEGGSAGGIIAPTHNTLTNININSPPPPTQPPQNQITSPLPDLKKRRKRSSGHRIMDNAAKSYTHTKIPLSLLLYCFSRSANTGFDFLSLFFWFYSFPRFHSHSPLSFFCFLGFPFCFGFSHHLISSHHISSYLVLISFRRHRLCILILSCYSHLLSVASRRVASRRVSSPSLPSCSWFSFLTCSDPSLLPPPPFGGRFWTFIACWWFFWLLFLLFLLFCPSLLSFFTLHAAVCLSVQSRVVLSHPALSCLCLVLSCHRFHHSHFCTQSVGRSVGRLSFSLQIAWCFDFAFLHFACSLYSICSPSAAHRTGFALHHIP